MLELAEISKPRLEPSIFNQFKFVLPTQLPALQIGRALLMPTALVLRLPALLKARFAFKRTKLTS